MQSLKIILIIVLLSLFTSCSKTPTYVDKNITFESEKYMIQLDMISQLGGILESQSTHITVVIALFGLIITFIFSLLSIFAYKKVSTITDKINTNEKSIKNSEILLRDKSSNIDDEIKQFMKEITKDYHVLRKEMALEFKEMRKEIKDEVKEIRAFINKEIKEEVRDRMLYVLDDTVSKVEADAYRKINHNLNKLTEDIQSQRFAYQKFIYRINQTKRLKYEVTMQSINLTTDEKTHELMMIQSEYNEINNQYIPMLFSLKVKEHLIPSAEKLSAYKKIQPIVIKFLEALLVDEKYTFPDKEDIREVLKRCYNWKEKEEEH